MTTFIGSAGWSVPKEFAGGFPASSSHLERYCWSLGAVEINSSFGRAHQIKTYARWAASVPGAFRFAVKVPRSITHEQRPQDVDALLDAFWRICGIGRQTWPVARAVTAESG